MAAVIVTYLKPAIFKLSMPVSYWLTYKRIVFLIIRYDKGHVNMSVGDMCLNIFLSTLLSEQ